MQSHRSPKLIIRPYQLAWHLAIYSGIVALCIGFGIAVLISEGGAKVSPQPSRHHFHHSQGIWVPMPYAIPVAICAALPFISLFVYAAFVALRARTTMTETGIIVTNSSGKESLRAKWEDVVEVSLKLDPIVEIVTTRGAVKIDSRHRRFAAAMAMVREHTGKSLT